MMPRPATFLIALPCAVLPACGSAPATDGPALPGLEQLQSEVQGGGPIVSSTGDPALDERGTRDTSSRPAFTPRTEQAALIGRLIVDCDTHLRAWNNAMSQSRDEENQELVQYTTQALGVLVAKNRDLLENQAISGASRNRAISLAALGFSGDFQVTPLLLNGVSSHDPEVMAKSLLGLGVLSNPETSMAPIHAAVTGPYANEEILSNAAFAMFQIAIQTRNDVDGTMTSALLPLLNAPDPSVRSQATLSLGLIRASLALPTVTDLLGGDISPDVRTAAAFALGQIGSQGSTLPLIGALKDPSEITAGAARAALVRIHGRDMGPDADGWSSVLAR